MVIPGVMTAPVYTAERSEWKKERPLRADIQRGCRTFPGEMEMRRGQLSGWQYYCPQKEDEYV